MVVTNHLFVLVTTLWFQLHWPWTTFKAATCLYWPKNAGLLATADKVYCTVTFAARDDLQSGEEHVNLNVAALLKSPHLLWAAILLLLHKSGVCLFLHVTDNLHTVSLSNQLWFNLWVNNSFRIGLLISWFCVLFHKLTETIVTF